MRSCKPAGVILAGGRSSRMGVEHKALAKLAGKPLLAHVLRRLQSQSDPLLLSCQSDTRVFEPFGLPVVADLKRGHRGPLTGLYSTLRYLEDNDQKNGLFLCPCDAPFIPENLVQVLTDAARDEQPPAVVISYQGELQPTFSLWQNHHLGVIRASVIDKGMGGLKAVLKSIPHKVVEWAKTEPSPFFNVNTPEDLATARKWLDGA